MKKTNITNIDIEVKLSAIAILGILLSLGLSFSVVFGIKTLNSTQDYGLIWTLLFISVIVGIIYELIIIILTFSKKPKKTILNNTFVAILINGLFMAGWLMFINFTLASAHVTYKEYFIVNVCLLLITLIFIWYKIGIINKKQKQVQQ